MKYSLRKANRSIVGEISLAGSKSVSNRALIIRALCRDHFAIHHLANARDTVLLDGLLASEEKIRDAGAAGTTFRFMTAYLAMQEGVQILTGTERMKQRPIGVLVDALRQLGASIRYLEKAGYPPLEIGTPADFGQQNRLQISAGTSSQYISALLMIAPRLPRGLELELVGKIVSRPYIEMTLNLMAYFGIQYRWEDNLIQISPQDYQARAFTIEADWSAASYYYIMAAFATELDLQLNGLFPDSVQGDAVLVDIGRKFGVETSFNERGVHLKKIKGHRQAGFSWDFIQCPDLAQSIAVICGGLGVSGDFKGVETLRIKETDRITALQIELGKLGVEITPRSEPQGKECFAIQGLARFDEEPVFATYEDHRMAMAFAPLAMFNPVSIADPGVVVKSYPDYFQDLEKIGFTVEQVK
jgi:3-phosphoshikimate 1-carboxyvinyltransferase